MSQIKKKHMWFKRIWQIFLLFIEIVVIVGGLTWGSCLLWKFESGLDVLERIGMFYGFYQIFTYIILSNLNDIKADEFLALKNTASIALKACEYNDEVWKNIVKNQIDKQMDGSVFNDIDVCEKYSALKQYIDECAIKNIEYMIIWAEHSINESQLQWKFSFLLRLVK